MSRLTDIVENIRDVISLKEATPPRIREAVALLQKEPGYVTIHDESGMRVGVLLHAMDFDKIEVITK